MIIFIDMKLFKEIVCSVLHNMCKYYIDTMLSCFLLMSA